MQPAKNIVKCLLCVLLAVFSSCHKKSNVIEISGKIKGLNTQWVYLFNVYPIFSKPIDSARISNNKFSFKIHPDTVYEPHLVNLRYQDKPNHWKWFVIMNPVTSKKGKNDLYADFIMELGRTELSGDLTKDKGITLNAGPQNTYRWHHIDLPFIRISSNPVKHKKQVASFIESVTDQPDAYFAMFSLDNLKYDVNKEELTRMYNAFDDETKQLYSGKKIKEFLNFKLGDTERLPNNLLSTIEGKSLRMMDTTKKLNMVIFWASWCGPCRQEIPSLKKIASEIKDENFRMVSVSIDRDVSKWKDALDAEKMPWQQLCIDSASVSRMDGQYNLNAIPQIYLIDSKRNMVKHFTGFEPENEALFKKTITGFLSYN